MKTMTNVNYEQLETESKISADLELQEELESRTKTTGGSHNTLRQVILRLVIDGNYPLAEEELKEYMNFRHDFPNFIFRCLKYVEHCKDLIHAIETKRQFRSLDTLSISKQQEFHDKVIEHFDELKDYLKQIEMVEREVRMDDIRSTVWVVQVFSQCVLGLVIFAFVLDMTSGMASSFLIVLNKFLNDGADWFVGLF